MDNIDSGRKVCSFCGENIASDFKRCPYCGSLLEANNDYYKTNEANTEDTLDNRYQNKNDDKAAYTDPYKFDKTIIDTNSVSEFTGRGGYNDQDIDFEDLETKPDISIPSMGNQVFDNSKQNDYSRDVQPQSQPTVLPPQPPQTPQTPQHPQQPRPQPQNIIPKPSLSNGMKVFFTSMCNLLPGIGQLIGVIMAIVFMNAEGDADKKSFGVALLISSIVSFVLVSIACGILIVILASDGYY